MEEDETVEKIQFESGFIQFISSRLFSGMHFLSDFFRQRENESSSRKKKTSV